MTSIRLMGLAAGALFFLSSTGNAQSPQAPVKAMPTAPTPFKGPPAIRKPRERGMRLHTVLRATTAGPTGYYGGTAGYPGGYDFGRPGYNPGGLGGPRSGLGVRPGTGGGSSGPGRLTVHGCSERPAGAPRPGPRS